MDFSLSSPAGGELEITINSQENNLPYKLPGSQTDIVKGRFGSMYFHHFKSDEFSIWSSVYDIKETTTIRGRADTPVLELHGSMENQIHLSWDGIKQSSQREDQYNMSFVPHVNNIVNFEAGTSTRTLDFHFTPSQLQRFAPYYPSLDKFLNKIEKKAPGSLTKEDCFITNHMRDCLYRIGDYYCHPALAGEFYGWKVKEFLLLMLDRAAFLHDKKSHPLRFTSTQKRSTEIGRDFLISDLARCPSIEEVAKKATLNECILKKCFTHLFGKPIHKYFIEKKMEKAKSLLLDPQLPVYEICTLLGYNDKQNFYNAFKKYAGKTPGEWCKENKINRKEVPDVINKSKSKK